MIGRRQLLASASIALAAGCSTAADRPDAPAKTTRGIDSVGWKYSEAPNYNLKLVLSYAEQPPSLTRLLNPTGELVWSDKEPTPNKNQEVGFGVPASPQGSWTLNTVVEGESFSQRINVSRSLAISSIEFETNTLIVKCRNDGRIPNLLSELIVLAGSGSNDYKVGKMLDVGENYTIKKEYQFDVYRDVTIHVFDGKDIYDQRVVDLL